MKVNLSKNSDELIKVFSADDERIKIIAEELSNELSRRILNLLSDGEISLSQIASQLDINIQTADYHVQRMVRSGLARITRVERGAKGNEVKFYTAVNAAVVILPVTTEEKRRRLLQLIRKKAFKALVKHLLYAVAAFMITSITMYMSMASIIIAPQLPPSISPFIKQNLELYASILIGGVVSLVVW
uniref:Transcriptional regulator n=1 Tax=Caldiarchaeum subterraneum TaxID=311458 RepID=E6NAV7_CALS0|nr:transcriptional regulator [Candidatus Caldarchaeum subterraneum]